MFEELIAAGLVKQKRYENGLSVFKYAKKVFYDRLWETDPLLMEARGMVLDDAGNKVIWPFTKVFNYLEYNAGADLWKDTQIIAPRKINGFMASVARYKGEIIVSTTGSLDSDFVGLAKEKLAELDLGQVKEGYTFLFEICHEDDPHIIEEEYGAWLIGCRCHATGHMASEDSLNNASFQMDALRPEVFEGTFGELWEMVRECKHEGWMVRLKTTGETVMKIKSPHYLSKKFIMRMGNKKVDQMFDNKVEFLKTLDEEFYAVVHYITRWWDKDKWKETSEADRRAVIEKYFEKEAQ